MFTKAWQLIIFIFAVYQFAEGLLPRRSRSSLIPLLTTTPACNKIVHVESSGVLNYLGNVTFTAPVNFKGRWHLEMSTNLPFTFLGGWGVIIKEDGLNKHADLFSTKITQLRIGDEITFRFRMSYARDKPIPYVTSLKWERCHICETVSELVTSIGNGSSSARTEKRPHLSKTNDFKDNVRRRYSTSVTRKY